MDFARDAGSLLFLNKVCTIGQLVQLLEIRLHLGLKSLFDSAFFLANSR